MKKTVLFLLCLLLAGCAAGNYPTPSLNMKKAGPVLARDVLSPLLFLEKPQSSFSRLHWQTPTRKPALFHGLSPATVRHLLGSPDLVRKEAPAESWRYDHADCALFLFFYPAGYTIRVETLDARPKTVRKIPLQACLKKVSARRRPQSSPFVPGGSRRFWSR